MTTKELIGIYDLRELLTTTPDIKEKLETNDSEYFYIAGNSKKYNMRGSLLKNPYCFKKDMTFPEKLKEYKQHLWKEYNQNYKVKQLIQSMVSLVKEEQEISLIDISKPDFSHGHVIHDLLVYLVNR